MTTDRTSTVPGRRSDWNSMVRGCWAVRAIGTRASTRSMGTAGSNDQPPMSTVNSRAKTNNPKESAQASVWMRRRAWSKTRRSRSRSPRATRRVSEGMSEDGTAFARSLKRSMVWNANLK